MSRTNARVGLDRQARPECDQYRLEVADQRVDRRRVERVLGKDDCPKQERQDRGRDERSKQVEPMPCDEPPLRPQRRWGGMKHENPLPPPQEGAVNYEARMLQNARHATRPSRLVARVEIGVVWLPLRVHRKDRDPVSGQADNGRSIYRTMAAGSDRNADLAMNRRWR